MTEAEQGIKVVCPNGHSQTLLTHAMSQAEAESYAGLLDGTHPLYRYPPRDYPVPDSMIGKCGMCGAWITATIFGYASVEGSPPC